MELVGHSARKGKKGCGLRVKLSKLWSLCGGVFACNIGTKRRVLLALGQRIAGVVLCPGLFVLFFPVS